MCLMRLAWNAYSAFSGVHLKNVCAVVYCIVTEDSLLFFISSFTDVSLMQQMEVAESGFLVSCQQWSNEARWHICIHSGQDKEFRNRGSCGSRKKYSRRQTVGDCRYSSSWWGYHNVLVVGVVKKGGKDAQRLDVLQVEKERGITVKAQTAVLPYKASSFTIYPKKSSL